MARYKKEGILLFTLLIAIFLQVVLALADNKDTPNRIAVKFFKAYYMLDRSMSQFICSEIADNKEEDRVDQFIHATAREASNRGFDLSYMRSRLLHTETHTTFETPTKAVVRVTGTRKRFIRPEFTLIGKIFQIGQTYEVDESIRVVKENGKWKVCDLPFSLSQI